MTKVNAIQLFENNKVRTVWDEDQEKWFISIIDVIQILQNRSCRHRTTFSFNLINSFAKSSTF